MLDVRTSAGGQGLVLSPLPPPWRWKESRSTPGDYYCVNEKTGERRWQAPSESKPKRSDDKITVVHCLLKHADSRRPSSHRTPKISLAKSDARKEADALRERVSKLQDMESALADEASKRSDCWNARITGAILMASGRVPSTRETRAGWANRLSQSREL